MKFGLPGRPRAALRREGSVVVFLRLLSPRPGSRAPLGRRCLCAERCWLQTQPGTGWPTTPQPGPQPPARRALPPRPPPPGPPARPLRPSPPTSRDPKFWRRGKVPWERAGRRRLRTRGAPSVFLKSTLPAAAAAAAAAAPAAESLGLQPGCSQVSRKTESAGRAPGKGWGWGAPTSRARRA